MERSPRYTAMVRQYWTRYRPAATAQLPDPEAFFQRLGTQIATEVAAFAHQLQGGDWPGETHVEKIGRVNAVTNQAQERVLAELLYSAAPEMSPVEELEELLAQLPSPEMVREDLTQIELDAQAQAEAQDLTTVLLTAEQAQHRRRLLELLDLVVVADLETMSGEEAAARVQALRQAQSSTE